MSWGSGFWGDDVWGSAPMLNPSFEIAGALPGLADNWTEQQSAGGVDIAMFSTASEPWDDFEQEWSSNELSQTLFGLSDLTYALFELLTQRPESFEHSWSMNQLSRLQFDSDDLDVAIFTWGGIGPGVYESYEAGWLNNEDFVMEFSAPGCLNIAYFNPPGGDTYESFEYNWYDNELSLEIPTYINVDFDSVPEAVEDFEEEWTSDLGW